MTLTFEELLEIYLQQNGRCAYSNTLLNLKGDFTMSLERKNIKYGYTKENCALICIEFNVGDFGIHKMEIDDRIGGTAWTAEKVKFAVNSYLSHKQESG